MKKKDLKNLLEEGIDIAMIQESQYTKNSNIPKFKGYKLYRQNRNKGRTEIVKDGEEIVKGGGVVTLVKHGIQHSVKALEILDQNDETTDALVVEINGNERDLTCINLYVPPIKSGSNDARTQNFNPNKLPNHKNTIICADINGHSPSWDVWKDEDKIGKMMTEWCDDNNMKVINDGSRTRTCPSTGNPSSPDVTIVHQSLEPRCTWISQPNPLSSDHHPIICSIEFQSTKINRPTTKKFMIRKANWTRFAEELDTKLKSTKPKGASLEEKCTWFETSVFNAAKLSIPYGSSGTTKKWFNDDCKAAIKKRNEAHKKWKNNPTDTEKFKEWRKLSNC